MHHARPTSELGPPPGWFADPWRVAPWRWWDGFQWTGYVWPATGAGWSAGPHAGASFPPSTAGSFRRAIPPTIGWTLLSMLVATVIGIAVAATVAVGGAGESTTITVAVAVVYPAMFWGFWWTAQRMSRRFGTGDMRADFGWRRFVPADIGWGVLAGIVALIVQVVLTVILPGRDDEGYRDAVFGEDPSVVMLIAMGIAIIVLAPLFEELLFRGPMMRSLIDRFGVWPGLVLQGVVFSLYHVVGNPTLARLWYLGPLFAVGVVFGFAAHRTGRMATAQIAHSFMNTIAFLGLLSTL